MIDREISTLENARMRVRVLSYLSVRHLGSWNGNYRSIKEILH